MAACAFLLARETQDPLRRRLIWLLLLGSFPGYLMLWVGNVQALTVLGLTLLVVGLLASLLVRPVAERFWLPARAAANV